MGQTGAEREEKISPRPLINGDNLISEFNITPGPLVGEILEAVREAQAIGKVSNVNEAIGYFLP